MCFYSTLFFTLFKDVDGQHVTNDETLLLSYIFSNYNKEVRPAMQKSDPVNLTLDLAYVQVVKLDDRSQTLISNVWVGQKWYNQHLKWNPYEFNNISVVNVSPEKIWVPDVVLYNSASSGIGSSMYSFKTKIIMRYDGLHSWYSPAIIRSSCNIDTTYFPFDDQLCILRFGSWTFDGYHIDMFPTNTSADLRYYLNSTEFKLLGAKVVREVVKYSCCPTPYPNIVFTVNLRRHPGYFMINVIIPSTVMTLSGVLTFGLPHLTGQRISLVIESFLSLTFLCMMVSDSTPINSDVSPLITKSLMLYMGLISLALVFNIISIGLKRQQPVPKWLRILAFNCIGPLVGVNHIIPKSPRYYDEENQEPYSKKNLLVKFHEKYKNIRKSSKKYETNKLSSDINILVSRSLQKTESRSNEEFWKCIGIIVDRLCLIVLGSCFLIVSIILFIKGYRHQIKLAESLKYK